MASSVAQYRRKTGFLNGMIAWFKAIAIGAIVIGALGIAILVVFAMMDGNPVRIFEVLMMPKFWGYIIGIPAAVMIYYLPYFIEIRKTFGDDTLTGSILANTFLGWFPIFWLVMLVLAITKDD
ncbi:hypothetical protein [Pseudoxanthomonas mexicana]